MSRYLRRASFTSALLAALGCGGSSGAGGGSAAGHDSGAVVADTGARGALDGSGGGPRDAAPSDSGAASDHAVTTSDAGHPAPGDATVDARTDGGSHPAADAATAGMGPYGSAGSNTVTTATFQVVSPADTFTTTAYIPSGAGAHPVVILSSGFEQKGAGYAPYASRLASWGIVTLLRDDPGLLSSLTVTDLASDVAYVVNTWLSTTSSDASSALHGKVDATKVGLAGHSRGGQVALLAAEGGAKGKILGVFGLDPVDTLTNNVEARTTLASVGVPVAFIGETTDSSGGVGGQPCAPAADNFQVLFQAAASPAVAITSVHADHTMYEDPTACTLCSFCTAGTASQAEVLATSVRYATAFFARQLLGDASVGAAFVGAGANQDVAAGVIQIESK